VTPGPGAASESALGMRIATGHPGTTALGSRPPRRRAGRCRVAVADTGVPRGCSQSSNARRSGAGDPPDPNGSACSGSPDSRESRSRNPAPAQRSYARAAKYPWRLAPGSRAPPVGRSFRPPFHQDRRPREQPAEGTTWCPEGRRCPKNNLGKHRLERHVVLPAHQLDLRQMTRGQSLDVPGRVNAGEPSAENQHPDRRFRLHGDAP
jgi:hypothetical protein